MANTNSDQEAKLVSNPPRKVGPDEKDGDKKVVFFSVAAVPTGAGDTMTLCRLPAGARVLGGSFAFGAAQGATATTAIGIAGTTGKYRTAAITNATTAFAIAGSIAENLGTQITADETVIATNAAAVWTTTTFKGFIEYIKD